MFYVKTVQDEAFKKLNYAQRAADHKKIGKKIHGMEKYVHDSTCEIIEDKSYVSYVQKRHLVAKITFLKNI